MLIVKDKELYKELLNGKFWSMLIWLDMEKTTQRSQRILWKDYINEV